uniref:Glutaredoxin and cysteine rich domain containing 2 n=1 Tax=Lepisosteus oculatus TaxID=7918 RepID=W5MWT3_LEPOC
MDELQIKLNQRFEGKPRKVRFKIASSYSGRVLKHVYEDGQELESPEDEYPHSFIHGKLPKHLEVEQLYGFGELREPELFSPPPLMAERINVYRGGNSFSALCCGDLPLVQKEPSSVLDFGKIIIYTSNLRIIRSPWVKKASTKSSLQNRDGTDRDSRTDEGGKEGQDYVHGVLGEDQSNKTANIFTTYLSTVSTFSRSRDEVTGCLECGGSGCCPCSLCHGSKLSMLANRFNESIRALRCPACNADGLQPCQSCAH